MSGGTLYLYDPENAVHDHLSAGVYEIDPLEVDDDERLADLLDALRATRPARRRRAACSTTGAASG